MNFREKELVFPYGSVPILSLTPRYDELELPYKVGDRLSEVQRTQIKTLVSRFLDTVTSKLGRTDLVKYEIKLKSDSPVRCRPYQSPPSPSYMRAQRTH